MLKIALCQLNVTKDKDSNLENAYKSIAAAAFNGAKFVALSEMFNCPYSGEYFPSYKEKEKDSITLNMLSKAAREFGVYIIGGSIPEDASGGIFNTSYVFNSKGMIVAKHRKVHLFDVNIENGIRFMESDYLTAGCNVTVFNTEYGRVGICICYDIRFPEMIRKMVLMGAEIIFVPAAFNMTTGPAHWELLFRARAMDNQVYMAGISPARDLDGVFKAYGNSIITNPWGEVIARAAEGQEIIYGEIDLSFEKKIREELPLLKHRKTDIYIG